MKSARLLTVVFLVVLAGVLVYLTSTAQQAECEVCMVFKGRRNCATAAAENETMAMQAARSTACGLIASGVRDSFACDKAPPATAECR